jgi:hypothetical protein
MRQWGQDVLHSCGADLEAYISRPLGILQAALNDLASIFTAPISHLMPRPALSLMAQTSSSLYLLEQLIWSHAAGEGEWPLDLEVFQRWVEEGGLITAIEDVKRVNGRTEAYALANSIMVYGPVRAKL